MITVSDLTPGQKEILEQWRTIARENQSGSTFSIEEEAKHTEIEERLPQFLDNPSEETFETLWNMIDKAFGQLFSVLSGDSVELPYERQNQVEIVSVDSDASDDKLRTISSNPDMFPVTPSWRLLATMNTYDKASLYEMSYAFMRRFNFVHVGIPDLETADGTIRASLLDPDEDDNYATAWLAQESNLESTPEAIYGELAVTWKVVNDYPRSIGPSIVQDSLGYADAYGIGDDPSRSAEALTAAIVGMVYPQLEGLRPDKQRNLVREFAGEWETDRGDVRLDVNEERLEAKAADYFDIRFDDE